MASVVELRVNPENKWRTSAPQPKGWIRSPRPGASEKYFIISADTHITPPMGLLAERIDKKYHHRLPRMERREDGALLLHIEGTTPRRIIDAELDGEDAYRASAGTVKAEDYESSISARISDLDLDGVDGEVVFPNGPATSVFWTADPLFAHAQFTAYNDWATEVSRPYRKRMHIAPCVGTADIDLAVAEVQRVAKLGFDLLSLPMRPHSAEDGDYVHYNHKRFEPLWAAIQDVDLTIAFHVGGRDPRVARGPGGAIINRAFSHTGMVGPITSLCGSGIFDRFPKLRCVTVEAGIGWIPSLIEQMDETYLKHHMWIRPKLEREFPSDYFRAHWGATYQEDRAGLLLMEAYGLSDCFCWANDYPHQEGTFPHSAAAIEREMHSLTEESREKVLGLNAARFFRFDVPRGYQRTPIRLDGQG